ncbi:MAG: hypothetical protein JXB49_13865, partial [Bacteroidales bacterium]|nr:hypothetical protein [Bacteroidales bacterium]
KKEMLTMNKMLSVLFLIAMIFFTSCNPAEIIRLETGKLSFYLPDATKSQPTPDDVSFYRITVTSFEHDYEQEQEGSPGQVVIFDNLLPGNYDVLVLAFNENNNLIFKGSTEQVEVIPGIVKKVDVYLDYATGSIEISFIFPEGTPLPTPIPVPTYYIGYEPGSFTPIDYSTCYRFKPDTLLLFLNEDFNSSEGWFWWPTTNNPNPIFYPYSPELTYVDGRTSVYFDCIDTGTDEWHLQLLQRNFVLTNHRTYEITIAAKSEPDRTIQVDLGMTKFPWTNYSVEKEVFLTSNFTEHRFVFKLNTPTDEHGPNGMKIDINLGAKQIDDSGHGYLSYDGSKVWVDKCYIRELDKTDVLEAESKTNIYGKIPVLNPFIGIWKEEGTSNSLIFWSDYSYDGVFENVFGDTIDVSKAFYNFDIIQVAGNGETYNEYDEQGDDNPANDTDVEGNFVLENYPFSDYVQTHGYSFSYDGTKLRLNLIQAGAGYRKWHEYSRQ